MARELFGALVAREKVYEFVAEDGDTAGFESDDGDARFNFGFEFVEDLQQQGLSAVEHAEIVERASAAEVGVRDDDAKARGVEDFDGSARSGGKEIVIERVRPEHDRRAHLGESLVFLSPLTQR